MLTGYWRPACQWSLGRFRITHHLCLSQGLVRRVMAFSLGDWQSGNNGQKGNRDLDSIIPPSCEVGVVRRAGKPCFCLFGQLSLRNWANMRGSWGSLINKYPEGWGWHKSLRRTLLWGELNAPLNCISFLVQWSCELCWVTGSHFPEDSYGSCASM